MQLYAAETASTLLTDEGIASLLLCVGTDPGTRSNEQLPSTTLESLLLMLSNCGTRGRSTASPDTIVELHNMVLHLKGSPDAVVSGLATQVAHLFD